MLRQQEDLRGDVLHVLQRMCHTCPAEEGQKFQLAAYGLCSSMLVLHSQEVCSHTRAGMVVKFCYHQNAVLYRLLSLQLVPCLKEGLEPYLVLSC